MPTDDRLHVRFHAMTTPTTPRPRKGLAESLMENLYGPEYVAKLKRRRRAQRAWTIILGTMLALGGAVLLSAAFDIADHAGAFAAVVAILGAFFVFAGVVLVGDLK